MSFGLALLRTFGGFSLDKQLFLMSQYSGNFISVVKFYVSVLNSWTVFKGFRQENDHFGLNEPLFYNPYLGGNVCTSNIIVKTFIEKGLTKVAHLTDIASRQWRPANEICEQVGFRSVRMVEHFIKSLKAAFTSQFLHFVNCFLSGESM